MNKPQRRTYVPKNWELPETIWKRLGPEPGRQRIMDEEGHLLLILHALPKAADDEVRQAALFWRAPDGSWKSSPSPGGLIALGEHVKAYRDQIHVLDEAVEKASGPQGYFGVMQEVQPILRATRHLLEVLQAARSARRDESALIGYRDEAAGLERGADLVAGDAKAGMDFSLAKSARLQSEAAHRSSIEASRLNRLVAFFFPLATLVSFFSMSQTREVLTSPSSWLVAGIGVLFGVVVLGIVTRGRK